MIIIIRSHAKTLILATHFMQMNAKKRVNSEHTTLLTQLCLTHGKCTIHYNAIQYNLFLPLPRGLS